MEELSAYYTQSREESSNNSGSEYPIRQVPISLHPDSGEIPIFVIIKVFDIPERDFDFRLSCLTDVRLFGQTKGSCVTPVLISKLRFQLRRYMCASTHWLPHTFQNIEWDSIFRTLRVRIQRKQPPVCQAFLTPRL